jgi:hypothetical protein
VARAHHFSFSPFAALGDHPRCGGDAQPQLPRSVAASEPLARACAVPSEATDVGVAVAHVKF